MPARPVGLLLAAISALAGLSCRREPSSDSTLTAPTPSSGTYGACTAAPAAHLPRARPFTNTVAWRMGALSVLQTELSPATLFHSSQPHLSLFTGLTNYGLGAPAWLAYYARSGPRCFQNSATLDATVMDENWLLVWFAGAHGWSNWDSPWAVFLQHKPTAMRLDVDGLHLDFREQAGDIVLMPLYGYYKPPPPGRDPLAEHGLPGKRIRTWEWGQGLHREPLMRVRYWASASRELPIYCEDSFSVDRGRDSVTIRQRFSWHSIDDDWRTPHMKVAPVTPPLGQVSRDRDFPAQFSHRVLDFELPTPYGPYMGVENTDQYHVTLPVLRYVNETETPVLAETHAHPVVAQAWQKLRDTARTRFAQADRYVPDHGGLTNLWWAIQGDQWYARALPYFDEPARAHAVASLRRYFREEVLVTNRFAWREDPPGSGRTRWLLKGPDFDSPEMSGAAAKFSLKLIETLWAYAHFTGDWELVRERWPLIKQLLTTGAETRWVGFGRDGMAELGAEAAPCLAMARLAYRVGDIDTYHYACYLFARELVHHWLKQRGADYFRRQQPWHSMEWMDEEVYLTQLRGDTAGWQLDGPNDPNQGAEPYVHRWARFHNADVGRFYRDWLRPEVKRELDALQSRWENRWRFHNDPHLLPSLIQLRSLLLSESPAELVAVATPDQFTGPPSGIIASCLSVIRTSRSPHYERLIPAAPPTPFVAGLEREVAGPNVYLMQSVQHRAATKNGVAADVIWPVITWWGWKTPSGARWNFGHVRLASTNVPARCEVVPLNWNTSVLRYEVR